MNRSAEYRGKRKAEPRDVPGKGEFLARSGHRVVAGLLQTIEPKRQSAVSPGRLLPPDLTGSSLFGLLLWVPSPAGVAARGWVPRRRPLP